MFQTQRLWSNTVYLIIMYFEMLREEYSKWNGLKLFLSYSHYNVPLLGELAKLWKATTGFVIDYTLITNLMHWLLLIHKILFSSTCFEPQLLIFRRIQLYTRSIWYCHSLWEFLVACRYTAWVLTQGISDHCGVLLGVEWAENVFVAQEKRLVPAYHKTNVSGLQQFLRDKLRTWANNGSCVEDIWKNFKDIVSEGIERFVPHKILKPNPDPEYYNKEVKRLKVKVRRA